jgi:hypothetical protein
VNIFDYYIMLDILECRIMVKVAFVKVDSLVLWEEMIST